MRAGMLAAALLLAAAGCGGPASPEVAPRSSPDGASAAAPRLAVASQPPGMKRCAAAPDDYPDPPELPRPAPVGLAGLSPDPVFEAMGIHLLTFRSRELVFHVSPDLSQATIDCTVAAADDAVAFVMRAMGLPPVIDGGPTREVFLLEEKGAADVLERLDPGYGFMRDEEKQRSAAFVGHPHARPDATAIFQMRRVPLSYLDIGRLYAHEWTHMIQDHLRGRRPSEITVVFEGEAELFGTLFQDAVVPGAGSRSWNRDAARLREVHEKHPEIGAYELLTQRNHRYHDELTLFSWIARGVDAPALARVRLLARAEHLGYDAAFQRVVGRELLGAGPSLGLDAVLAAPETAPRPAVAVTAPALSVVRSEDLLWFVAAGFRPGERVARSTRFPDGHAGTDAVEADGRGVVVWSLRVGRGPRWASGQVDLRGASGACSAPFSGRVL